jgi:mono/diheme cytochrome c family protein
MVAMAILAFTLSAGKTDAATLRPDDADIVSRGQKVYAANCASCHGQQLEGQPNWRIRDQEGYLPAPPHDATGHSWHHSDEQLFELTKYGLVGLAGADYKTRMPAYEGILSDEDLVAVLSFIKSRWPESIRKRHDRLNAAANRAAGSRR